MPTPKPGQIRCPTCNRSTPPGAFCTQCGAPIPTSAHVRPRGMDRQELEEKVRLRRPGEGALRRGTPIDEHDGVTAQGGYVPFQPEPEDAMAVREPDASPPAPNVDNTPSDFDTAPPASDWPRQDVPDATPPRSIVPPIADESYRPRVEQHADEPVASDPEADLPPEADVEYEEPAHEAPYGGSDGAYPYPYLPADDGRRGGSSALPIIGFIVLAVLALGVGAVLAGLFAGGGGVGRGSPTPSATETLGSSVGPTAEPSASESEQLSSTPEPTDGPITFPDGAVISVQPCATQAMSFDGCDVDGSTITNPTMWVWIGFEDASGSDTFILTLGSEGQTIDQQEKQLGAILDCPGTCSGYLIGAAYRDLAPGDYELVVRRDGDFADSATFTVEG